MNSYLNILLMFSREDVSLLAEIATVIILFFGALYGVWQLKGIQEQTKLNVFTTYTERYSNIVDHMPDEVNNPEKSMLSNVPEGKQRSELMGSIRAFFNLCSEEFYLSQRNLIDRKVWQL